MTASQSRTAKSAALVFARLQVEGRFADQWKLLVPTQRTFVSRSIYTNCMAPFHSRTKLLSIAAVRITRVSIPPRIEAMVAALVTVHLRAVSDGLCLVGLRLRALRSHGTEPAILVAVSRRSVFARQPV